MGRLRASLLALALGLAAAVALSACGSGGNAKLLPGATASQITSNLDQVQELVGEGECIGAQNAAAAVSEQVEELNGVDAKLKQALSEGANRLNEVVSSCEEETGPSEAEEQAEEQEGLEAAEEEETEKTKKPAKEKNEPEKEAKEPKEEKEPPVKPEPPVQEEQSEAPPAEPGGGAGAGGVGPGAPVGED
jgi:septal ring-binding cell division protein DamX